MKKPKNMKVSELTALLLELGVDPEELAIMPGKKTMVEKYEQLTKKPVQTNFFTDVTFDTLLEQSDQDGQKKGYLKKEQTEEPFDPFNEDSE